MLSADDRILITGGGGLIGSHIADQMARQFNSEIIILDNFTRGRRENLRWALTHGCVEVVEGDIRDAALVHEIMNGIDVVFHHAAIRPSECAEDPRRAMEVITMGTFNILEAAVLNRVRKVVSASSASVYGEPESALVSERHHTNNNRSLHGAAMTFSEALLRSFYYSYDLNYVALRYFNIYGPRMDVHSGCTELIVRWMERIARRQPCIINGDGKQTLDLVYVEDIARANILAANSDVTNEVFNIASGQETTLNEFAVMLGRIMGSNLAPEYSSNSRGMPVHCGVADTAKAREMLGFNTMVSLEEGLSRLVAWWERQRALDAVIV